MIILQGKEYNEKKSTLTKVQSESSGWITYYVDSDSKKWIEEYPQSENHGGGLPQLRQLEKFPWEQFSIRQFRFKTEYFKINGIWNIEGLIICSGNGYDPRTYCCINCGELFVIEFSNGPRDVNVLTAGKFCPRCGVSLSESLMSYPENILYQGTLLKNSNLIDKLNFDKTELRDVYVLS